jgi:hypothetical protein
MELSPSRQIASCTATQELLSILWDPNVHYRVHKISPFVCTLSHINSIHITHSIFPRSILILHTLLRINIPSDLFFPGFLISNLYIFLLLTIHATFHAHLISLT